MNWPARIVAILGRKPMPSLESAIPGRFLRPATVSEPLLVGMGPKVAGFSIPPARP